MSWSRQRTTAARSRPIGRRGLAVLTSCLLLAQAVAAPAAPPTARPQPRWRALGKTVGAAFTALVPRAARVEEHAANASTAVLAAADFTSPRVFGALAAVGGPVMVATSVKDSVRRARDRIRERGPGARFALRDLRDAEHLNNLSGVAWGAEMPVWAASMSPKLAGLSKVAAGIGTAGAVCQIGFGCMQIRNGLRARDGWQVAQGVVNVVGGVGWAGAELSGHPALTATFLGAIGINAAIDHRAGIGRALKHAQQGLTRMTTRARAAACRFGRCVSGALGRQRSPIAAAADALR